MEIMKIPRKTLDWMIDRAEGNPAIAVKLKQIATFDDGSKLNRWFGYYQAKGENEGLWTLDEIADLVRVELHGKCKPGEKSLQEIANIPKYTARPINVIKNQPGAWDSNEIGVFDGDTKIGSYKRTYPSFMKTFFPFTKDGKWYALFSSDYTRIDVMELPSCKVIGGEPKATGEGFCPVEIYVPNYIKLTYPDLNKKDDDKWVYEAQIDPREWHVTPEHEASYHHFNFGFVSGCYWGDDWSWKIQHLDLSRVDEGIVTRSEKFGYVWLLPGIELKDAVEIILFDDPSTYRINLSIGKTFYVNPEEAKDYTKYSTDKDD